MSSELPRVRSALYIPGQRADFLAKADKRGADAVIIDLEDSVSASGRSAALDTTHEWIESRADPLSPVVFVRINAVETGRLTADLETVVSPNLTGVVVPKVMGAADVRAVSEALSFLEGQRGIPQWSIAIWPLIETAVAVQNAPEISRSSRRIAYMGGGAADEGDLAHAIGFRWTVEAQESYYIRSKVLVDVRAAGVHNPMTGMVSSINEPEELRIFARQSKNLGYEGMMVIHPAHVEEVNRTFAPTEEEYRAATGVLAALAEADSRGSAAVVFGGRMVDQAMVQTCERLIREYERFQASEQR
ncbi:MAG: CoA ester lyase [Acidimicrobiales bacterium]